MIIGLFVDIWNWFYTRSRIQLMRDAKEIWIPNKLKLSFLGVLYTIVEVDKSIPEHLIGRYLIGKLRVIDDALVAINLDGLIKFEFVIYAEDDVMRYVLVKFIPVMPHWNIFYFVTSTITAAIIAAIIWYFNLFEKAKILIESWV